MNKYISFLSLPFVLFLVSGFIIAFCLRANSVDNQIYIGRLQYHSGGDWYSNPSSLPNLIRYFKNKTHFHIADKEIVVSFADNSYRRAAIIYFTGHGNFSLSALEKENLRKFLDSGGFLFADDNYGMDKDIRRELNSLYPQNPLREIPPTHRIFRYPYPMKKGFPKIHVHDGGKSVAYGIFLDGVLKIIYAHNTDLGDGWEDPDIHNDGPEKRELALQMGTNILYYALNYAVEY